MKRIVIVCMGPIVAIATTIFVYNRFFVYDVLYDDLIGGDVRSITLFFNEESYYYSDENEEFDSLLMDVKSVKYRKCRESDKIVETQKCKIWGLDFCSKEGKILLVLSFAPYSLEENEMKCYKNDKNTYYEIDSSYYQIVKKWVEKQKELDKATFLEMLSDGKLYAYELEGYMSFERKNDRYLIRFDDELATVEYDRMKEVYDPYEVLSGTWTIEKKDYDLYEYPNIQ